MNQTKSVGRYISHIYRNFHIYMHHKLEQYGLGSGQFHFLMMLYRREGTTQEALAEDLKIDKATCARAIQKLEELGYAKRQRNQQDKRCYNIYLTPKAIELKPTAMNILQEWTDRLLSDFSKEEKKQLFIFLEKLSKNTTYEQTLEQ